MNPPGSSCHIEQGLVCLQNVAFSHFHGSHNSITCYLDYNRFNKIYKTKVVNKI
jgi:hypothetical protein